MKKNNFLMNKVLAKQLTFFILAILLAAVSAQFLQLAINQAPISSIDIAFVAAMGISTLTICYSLITFSTLKDSVYLYNASFILCSFIAISVHHEANPALIGSTATPIIFKSLVPLFNEFLNYDVFMLIACIPLLLLTYRFYQDPKAETSTSNKATPINQYKKQQTILIISTVLLLALVFTASALPGYIANLLSILGLIITLVSAVLVIASYDKTSLNSSRSLVAVITTVMFTLLFNILYVTELVLFLQFKTALFILFTFQVFLLMFALSNRINKQSFQQINNLRYHQGTGLPSKIILAEKIKQLIDDEHNEFSVLVIQPENINEIKKYINEADLSHSLNVVVHALIEMTEANDNIIELTKNKEKIAFIEGNCFALIVKTNATPVIESVIQALQSTITQHFAIKTLHSKLMGVIGISQYPLHSRNENTLINCALLALKHARNTKQKWCYYHLASITEKQSVSADFTLALQLKDAITNNELEIYHQPQLDLKMLRVCGNECLLRWRHKTKGIIEAESIIPIAEDLGLMNLLTLWTVKTALAQHKEICEEGGYNHMVSINISPVDVLSTAFLVKLLDIIEHSEVPCEKIILELNNSALIINNDDALSVMEQLTEIGITVSVDDFYSGYTTLASYQTLPFQELKIEGQFVAGLSGTARQKSITETTIKMAKSLSLEVVAEGINSQWEQDTLIKFGCDIGQGDFYSEPLNKTQYANWLAAQTQGKVPESHYGEFIPAKK